MRMEPDNVVAAIKELRDFTEFSMTKLTSHLGTQLTSVEGRLTSIEGRLPGVEGRLMAIEGRLGHVEARTEDLETVTKGFPEVRERLTSLERSRPRA
jgi:hypothetical protein